MYTAEMLESIKKVEATRAQRLGTEPRRMTAEEKRSFCANSIRITKQKASRRFRLDRIRERRFLLSWELCFTPIAVF